MKLKRISLILISLLVVISLCVPAVALMRYEHCWNLKVNFELSEAQEYKMAIIGGMLDGIRAVAPERISKDVVGVNILTMQIDTFFKDPANRKIPAVIMLNLANGGFRGALSDQEIEQQFLELRNIIPAK